MVTTPQQSQGLSRHQYPCVIVSASGMTTGGGVLHHLEAMAPNPRHNIVFPGCHVPGTHGGKRVAGASDIKIDGEYVAVKAQVSQVEGLSARADADGLMAWLRGCQSAPRQVFVVHGEPGAADALRMRMRIQDELV